MTQILSAFPGCGKTHFHTHATAGTTSDSDSSQFDKASFPENYTKHILCTVGEVDYLFISSHAVVRQVLLEMEVPYTLFLPVPEAREAWLERLKDRGSPDAFVALIDANWDTWTAPLPAEETSERVHIIRLAGDEFIADRVAEAPTEAGIATRNAVWRQRLLDVLNFAASSKLELTQLVLGLMQEGLRLATDNRVEGFQIAFVESAGGVRELQAGDTSAFACPRCSGADAEEEE